MTDAANPASPTHKLVSEFGWTQISLFKLYCARRSMRLNNTGLGLRELKEACDLGSRDADAHGLNDKVTTMEDVYMLADRQLNLAMAYATD